MKQKYEYLISYLNALFQYIKYTSFVRGIRNVDEVTFCCVEFCFVVTRIQL